MDTNTLQNIAEENYWVFLRKDLSPISFICTVLPSHCLQKGYGRAQRTLFRLTVYTGSNTVVNTPLFYHKLKNQSGIQFNNSFYKHWGRQTAMEVSQSIVRAWQGITVQELALWVFGLAKSCTPRWRGKDFFSPPCPRMSYMLLFLSRLICTKDTFIALFQIPCW